MEDDISLDEIRFFQDEIKRSTSSTHMSLIIALMSAMTAITMTFIISSVENDNLLTVFENLPDFLRIFIVTLIIPFISLTLSSFLKYVKEKERDRKRISVSEKEDFEEENKNGS